MKSKDDFNENSLRNQLPFLRTSNPFNSKSVHPSSNTIRSSNDHDYNTKEFDSLKKHEELIYEQARLAAELKELKEKNMEFERKQMMLLGDLDKQSLSMNEKMHEIDYWKNKYMVIESSLSRQNSEIDKLSRMNADLGEVSNKWKEKYAEFERTYLEQQNQFEALKIKYKRLEKKNEQLANELNESKEIIAKNDVFNNQLHSENEKWKRNFQEMEAQQQKYIDEIEALGVEFNEYKTNNDLALEEARDEGAKMIQELHLSYKEVIHKKMQSETQAKQMMEQIKELQSRTQKQESSLLEKENQIIELGIKLNEKENHISELNFQLSQKDQNFLKMKSEYNGSNFNGGRILNDGAPGMKLLEAKVESQQAEIISLKKNLEFNERFKSNEKLILEIKSKEKECDEVKEKLRVMLNAKKTERRPDAMLEDLKIRLVLITSENERLHQILRDVRKGTNEEQVPREVKTWEKMKNNDINIDQINKELMDNKTVATQPTYFEKKYQSYKNSSFNDGETVPRISLKKKFFSNGFNEDFVGYSPNNEKKEYRDFYSPTYRDSNRTLRENKSTLLQNYEESNRHIEMLKNQLQNSLRKKETYLNQLKPQNFYY